MKFWDDVGGLRSFQCHFLIVYIMFLAGDTGPQSCHWVAKLSKIGRCWAPFLETFPWLTKYRKCFYHEPTDLNLVANSQRWWEGQDKKGRRGTEKTGRGRRGEEKGDNSDPPEKGGLASQPRNAAAPGTVGWAATTVQVSASYTRKGGSATLSS